MRALAVCAVLVATPALAEVPPEEDYALQCQGCHGHDGRGSPGTVPSLVGVDRYLAMPGGREYVVRVPGVAQASISDARLTALLNWAVVRFGEADGRASPAFDVDEVSVWRREPLADAAAAKAALTDRAEGD